MDFEKFTQKFEGSPPTFTSEKQVPTSQKIICFIQRLIATAFWGAILPLAAAVIADAL